MDSIFLPGEGGGHLLIDAIDEGFKGTASC